jgi:ubiquinone/menaquinone biosynthesis C-methylase UbiE
LENAARPSFLKRACGVFCLEADLLEVYMKWNSGQIRGQLCDLVALPPQGALLDVGCGDGSDLRQISRRAGLEACLVGVDLTEASLAKAREAAGRDTRFSFTVADLSQSWPFERETFDVVFSNNVLECLGDKAAFLAELARVLRPGGQVLCAHWDHDMQTIDGPDKALIRRVVAAFSDWQQAWMRDADGWMGRRLWPTFQATGFFTGQIETYTLTETEFVPGRYGYEQIHAFGALVQHGQLLRGEYRSFLESVEASALRGEYFYSRTLYVYVGKKL